MKLILILFLCIVKFNFDSYVTVNSNKNNLVNVFTADISSDLIAHYKFNGNAEDELANYPGIIFGAKPSFDRFGKMNSAFEFDGKDDYVNLGLDYLSYDSMTISLWIFATSEPDPLGENQYFIASGEPDVSVGVYGVWNEGTILTGHGLTTSSTENISHSMLSPYQWYNIVMTFDAVVGNAETYINGTLVHTEIYESAALSDPLDSLFLGKANFSDDYGFKGMIDELRVYSRKLTTLDVQDLYNDGCIDTLTISKLELENDTVLYAKSFIQVDTISLDTAYEVYMIAPVVKLDTGFTSALSSIHIKPGDGCNQPSFSASDHYAHRGIYINNFVSDGILGDSLQEDSLLKWCAFNEFNNIYLYNIGSALSMGMEDTLDSFVLEAHQWTPAISVTFVSAGFGGSFTDIENYHDNYTNIPKGIVSEIEFWNGSMTYADDYAPWIDKVNSLKYDTVTMDSIVRNPNLKRRFYIGKIKDGGEPVSMTIAENLVINHDEIFLTNYHTDGFNLSNSSSENSIRNKLSLLGEAGFNLQQKVNIVILFNVRQDSPAPQIWDYFDEYGADHEFRHAYQSFYHDFINATDITYKQYINLVGYGIYRHSDAKEARGGG